MMSFLFAELLCCKAIMFMSIRRGGVLKGPYVFKLPFCNVTVFQNFVILLVHVRSVEIPKLLLSCLSTVLSLC